MDRLLAKSPYGGGTITLPEHTAAVVKATRLLFGTVSAPTRLGRAWIRFFRIKPEQEGQFFLNLELAAVFHDVGKGNDGFQNAVRGRADNQTLRHEHLSALLLCIPEVAAWVGSRAGADLPLVRTAVAGHHMRLGDKGIGVWSSTRQRVHVFLDHPDVRAVLTMAEPLLGPAPTRLSVGLAWCEQDVERLAAVYERDLEQAEEEIEASQTERRSLWLAVKAALVAADAAASGILRTGQDLEQYIDHAFGQPLMPTDVVERIIRSRLEEMARRLGRSVTLHDFQEQAAHLGQRALLLAPCGSGKTLAAWNWVQARLKERPAGRVIFLYPTRATATEGFKDYGASAGPEAAALMHGTADYELETMQPSPDWREYRLDPRLPALAAWQRRVITATVDTFLPFLHFEYQALCLLPVLADAVVVVDEVHSYDASMFLDLLVFLRQFDVPVLCMTATLPERRRDLLVMGCGFEPYPTSLEQFQDLKAHADRPRYRIQTTTEEEAWEYLREHFGKPSCRKVLWVVNTVARCQRVAARAVRELGTQVICYHSLFRLMDRRERHEELIDRFRSSCPVVAVTTQVCEMSLDVDADVLITEAAPIPSLVQRMGRCCRQPVPPSTHLGRVLVYLPEDNAPYEETELAQGWQFARSFSESSGVSQSELADRLAATADTRTLSRGQVPFVDQLGLAAPAGEFRDTSDYTVDAVLDTDIEVVTALRRQRRPVDGYILPVPMRWAKSDPQLGYLRVAPASRYDPDLGFLVGR